MKRAVVLICVELTCVAYALRLHSSSRVERESVTFGGSMSTLVREASVALKAAGFNVTTVVSKPPELGFFGAEQFHRSYLGSSVPKACSGSSLQPILGPVTTELGQYFASKNITVYPWAITMIGALRWGSMSLRTGNEEFIMDHDMDFLVQMPEGTSYADAVREVNGFQTHLHNQVHIESLSFQYQPMNHLFGANEFIPLYDRSDGVWNNPSGADHMILWLYHPNFFRLPERTGENADNEGFARHLAEAVHRQAGSPDDHYVIAEDKISDGVWSPTLKRTSFKHTTVMRNIELMEANMKYSSKVAHALGQRTNLGMFEIDLWVRPGTRFDKSYEPSPNKKVLFLGQPFPCPENLDVVAFDMKSIFLERQYENADPKAYNSMCALALPNGLFPEDMQARGATAEAAIKLTRECFKDLDDKGFTSFGYCKAEDPAFLHSQTQVATQRKRGQ